MARKIGLIFLITCVVVITYVIMLGMQGATNELIATANASGNWTNSPETQAIINSFPLWQWFIPGGVGMIMSVFVWKSKD